MNRASRLNGQMRRARTTKPVAPAAVVCWSVSASTTTEAAVDTPHAKP